MRGYLRLAVTVRFFGGLFELWLAMAGPLIGPFLRVSLAMSVRHRQTRGLLGLGALRDRLTLDALDAVLAGDLDGSGPVGLGGYAVLAHVRVSVVWRLYATRSKRWTQDRVQALRAGLGDLACAIFAGFFGGFGGVAPPVRLVMMRPSDLGAAIAFSQVIGARGDPRGLLVALA